MKAVMGVQKVFMALQVLTDNWDNNHYCYNYSILTLEMSLLQIIFGFPFCHLWTCKMFNVSDQKWIFRMFLQVSFNISFIWQDVDKFSWFFSIKQECFELQVLMLNP